MRTLIILLASLVLSLVAVPASAADIEFCIGGICGDKHGMYPRESWEDRYRSWDEYCWDNWRDDPNCEEEGYFDEPGFSPGPEWQPRHWHHRDHRDFHPAPMPESAPIVPRDEHHDGGVNIPPPHHEHNDAPHIEHHELVVPHNENNQPHFNPAPHYEQQHHEFHGAPPTPHYEYHDAPHAPAPMPHAPMPGSGSHPEHHH